MSEFEENIILIYGERGRKWLKSLPSLISQLSVQWGLRDLVPCEHLSYNYVLSGCQDNSTVILKAGVDIQAIQQECEAICAFKGHGLIELLNSDFDKGAILIARAIPGETLTTLFPSMDNEALGIACRLAECLHKAPVPVGHKFPHLSEWLSILDKDWDLPKEQLQLARNLKKDLLNNSLVNVLLHGDLHYANILSDGDDWLVIDPKGVMGNSLYDITGALLREPFKKVMELSNISGMLKNRMEFVAQYSGSDIKQVWAWTYVQTVMSICWSLEDGQDVILKQKFLDILSAPGV